MGTLYVIGGSARSGKTTILNTFIKAKPMVAFSSDAVREGVRNVLVGESYVSIDSLQVNGKAEFRRPGDGTVITKEFSDALTEDEFTWRAVVGIISHYDRKNISIIVEGLIFTPERISSLPLVNLRARAAFVGFLEDGHLDAMLHHAHEKKDWVFRVIEEHNGDDKEVRKWFEKEKGKNKDIALAVKNHGGTFFSLDNKDFEEYIQEVSQYLLNE